MCREEAAELASLIPRLQQEGAHVPRLIAICHEYNGSQLFRAKHWPGGEVYIDRNRTCFKAIGDLYSGASGLFSFAFLKNLSRAKGKNFKGNTKGEGRYLGGVLIVGPGSQGVVYQYNEQAWGDHAPLDSVYAALKTIKPATSATASKVEEKSGTDSKTSKPATSATESKVEEKSGTTDSNASSKM